VILGYHMVAGEYDSDFDVLPETFRAQMEYIAQTFRVRSLDSAVTDELPTKPPQLPTIVLTFDDAYRDFFEIAYPILKELNLPATLYVPVGFVDDPKQYPVSPIPNHNCPPPPCTWDMLGELASSRLITIGCHSYAHKSMPTLSLSEQDADIAMASTRLANILGVVPTSFAWPFGHWNRETCGVAKRHFAKLLGFGGGSIRSDFVDLHRLPRIPIRSRDDWDCFTRKCRGLCDGEELLRAAIRRSRQP